MIYPKSLSSRLKLLTILWVMVAVGSILLTLLLSWRLEGAGAAINDAGSLRMQTYRLGLLISEHRTDDVIKRLAQFEHTLTQLQKGDSSRPLFLPKTQEVQEHMRALTLQWENEIRPMLETAIHQPTIPIEEQKLNDFVHSIDTLVSSIEEVNRRYTEWLRLFQSGLMALV